MEDSIAVSSKHSSIVDFLSISLSITQKKCNIWYSIKASIEVTSEYSSIVDSTDNCDIFVKNSIEDSIEITGEYIS